MAATKRTKRRPSVKAQANGASRALERRVTKLQEQLRTERAKHTRQVAAVRRAGDRQTAALVREIALLRHHEARAETLARLLSEREAALAAQGELLAQLESRLQVPVSG
jgi:hypothetical protein